MFNNNIFLLIKLSILLIGFNGKSKKLNLNTHHKNNITFLNNVHKNYNKIRKFNFYRKRNGMSINHKIYNILVQRYNNLIKIYRKNRNSMCTKFSLISVLKKKNKNDLDINKRDCKHWFYEGRVLGNNIALAIHKLGNINKFSRSITHKLLCIYRMFNYKKAINNKQLHQRNCYIKGYNKQFKNTSNMKKNLIIKKPFRSCKSKILELKTVIKRFK